MAVPNAEQGLRVLHCPFDTSGGASGLARAEREIGLQSRSVAFWPHAFGYNVDEVLWDIHDGRLQRERKRWAFLRRVFREFDVVHFHFGSTLMPIRRPWSEAELSRLPFPLRWVYWLYGRLLECRDLKWLRRAGKAVFVTYAGDDARQGDYCREHFEITFANEVNEGRPDSWADRQKRRRIAQFDRSAHGIYAKNPDLLHVLPERAEFLPYAAVDPLQIRPSGPPPGHRARPLVVHAPSDRAVKGTRFILSAVERLQLEDRLDFDFRLVENLTHSAALEVYAQADVVVDQLLAGWYGVLAAEAMAMGRPVLCYLREEDLHFIPAAMRTELPLLRAEPNTIYEVLRTWLTNRRGELAAVGARSRRFVETWHDPRVIAARLRADYQAAIGNEPKRSYRGRVCNSSTMRSPECPSP